MALVLDTIKRNSVYYMAGKFDGDHAVRFQRAPFCQVLIKGKLYLMPESIGISPNFITLAGDSNADSARQVRHDFGYETRCDVILEEHQMGFKDDADSWMGPHKFGRI